MTNDQCRLRRTGGVGPFEAAALGGAPAPVLGGVLGGAEGDGVVVVEVAHGDGAGGGESEGVAIAALVGLFRGVVVGVDGGGFFRKGSGPTGGD